MTVTSSYGVEIRKMNICFRKTLEYYRKAVSWLIRAFDSVWEELEQIPGTTDLFRNILIILLVFSSDCNGQKMLT